MIWEAETCKHLYKFTGHKGPVSVSDTSFCVNLHISNVQERIVQSVCSRLRVFRSGKELMTCTVHHTTVQSRCGT